MRNKKSNQTIFWDYNLKRADLSNPQIKIWYLSRKLRFGDFSGISKSDLKKHLRNLNINPSLKELLRNYLKSR